MMSWEASWSRKTKRPIKCWLNKSNAWKPLSLLHSTTSSLITSLPSNSKPASSSTSMNAFVVRKKSLLSCCVPTARCAIKCRLWLNSKPTRRTWLSNSQERLPISSPPRTSSTSTSNHASSTSAATSAKKKTRKNDPFVISLESFYKICSFFDFSLHNDIFLSHLQCLPNDTLNRTSLCHKLNHQLNI